MTRIEFSVTGIQGQSDSASALAADLRSIQKKWLSSTADPAPALGLTDLIDAFDSMREAWQEQFTTFIEVVSDLSSRLGQTSHNYGTTEQAITTLTRPAGG